MRQVQFNGHSKITAINANRTDFIYLRTAMQFDSGTHLVDFKYIKNVQKQIYINIHKTKDFFVLQNMQ